MTFAELKKYYGSRYKFEEQTGLAGVVWTRWKKQNRIPIGAQLKIQKATNGVLKIEGAEEVLKELLS